MSNERSEGGWRDIFIVGGLSPQTFTFTWARYISKKIDILISGYPIIWYQISHIWWLPSTVTDGWAGTPAGPAHVFCSENQPKSTKINCYRYLSCTGSSRNYQSFLRGRELEIFENLDKVIDIDQKSKISHPSFRSGLTWSAGDDPESYETFPYDHWDKEHNWVFTPPIWCVRTTLCVPTLSVCSGSGLCVPQSIPVALNLVAQYMEDY